MPLARKKNLTYTGSMPQNTPHWTETRWRIALNQIDDFGLWLTQMGSLGSYENLPLEEAELIARTTTELIAYFPDTKSSDAFADKLKTHQNDKTRLLSVTRIPQADWATAWKKYFKPFKLTDNVVIRPSWEPYEKQAGEIVVTLDPGMAFGTGQHDTTRFCAEIIPEIKKNHPELKSLLDVGCGSGILSIIARYVGFTDVVGIDIDEASIDTANENLARNPEAMPLTFFTTSGEIKKIIDPKTKKSWDTFDVVAANIIAETLCELKNDLVNLVKPNGLLILSGILPERATLITEAFSDLKLITEKKSKDWHAYLYRRQ